MSNLPESKPPQRGSSRFMMGTAAPVCVVVGGGSGIGRATAHVLSGRGRYLVLAGRARAPLEDAAEECRRLGAASVTVVPTDVRVEAQISALVRTTLDEHGRIDEWVHSAAVMAYGNFEQTPADLWRQVVETSLFGAANSARSCLTVMRAQGSGVFVVVNSVLGQVATPYMSAYVTSKWALRGLTRCLRLELREVPGVQVVSVHPGPVNTPIYHLAANLLGRQARPLVPVDPPERVALRIADVLDHPVAERGVGRINAIWRLGFRLLPAVYERLAGPVMDRFSFTSTDWPSTYGNVLEPIPEGAAVHGSWPSRRTARGDGREPAADFLA
jgi:NAD(P)-dependent dehydrogenase (short-subunit alcohol dehydrogenase family)